MKHDACERFRHTYGACGSNALVHAHAPLLSSRLFRSLTAPPHSTACHRCCPPRTYLASSQQQPPAHLPTTTNHLPPHLRPRRALGRTCSCRPRTTRRARPRASPWQVCGGWRLAVGRVGRDAAVVRAVLHCPPLPGRWPQPPGQWQGRCVQSPGAPWLDGGATAAADAAASLLRPPPPPAEAVVQSLLLPAETSGRYFSLSSKEGDGPGVSQQRWAELFASCR
jgi:hypothetical protein